MKTIHGWLTESEARMLHSLASECSLDAIEIGSCHGRSTFVLAQAVASKPGRRLWAFDPHYQRDADYYDDDDLGHFYRTMNMLPISTAACIAKMTCGATKSILRDALACRLVDFAFIDGDHSTAAVLADLEAVVPIIRPGGLVACHDTTQRRVGLAIEMFMNGDGKSLTPAGGIDSLGVYRVGGAGG